MHLTASVPSGGRASSSSREAWTACTACMLELMVPVKACWADVCNRYREHRHLTVQPKQTALNTIQTRQKEWLQQYTPRDTSHFLLKSRAHPLPSEKICSWNTVIYASCDLADCVCGSLSTHWSFKGVIVYVYIWPEGACVLCASAHWWCAVWPAAWSPSGSSLDLRHQSGWWLAEQQSPSPPSQLY